MINSPIVSLDKLKEKTTASENGLRGVNSVRTPTVNNTAQKMSQSAAQPAQTSYVPGNGAAPQRQAPATATVYPQNGGTPYTGYVIDGKTYKDSQGKQRIDNGSAVKLADGRTYAMPGAAHPNAADAYQTVYTDASGNQYTGWIIDGQTYTDPQGTRRVPEGSVVTMANGLTAVKGKDSGYYTPATVRATTQQGRDAALDGYDEALGWRTNAQRAAEQFAVEQYNRRAEQIRRDAGIADKKAHDAYLQVSNPYGAIGQRLEALGLGDSGYAESTYANLGNEYQKLLTERSIATQDALAQIYGDIEAARVQGEYEAAMANAQTAEQKAAVQMQYDQFLANLDTNNYWSAEQAKYRDEQAAYAKEQDALNRALHEREYADSRAAADREIGYNLLQYGVDPKYIAETYGISETEANAIASYIQRQEAAAAAKQRSSGGSNANNKKGSPDDVIAYISGMSEGAAYAWLTKQGGYSHTEAQELLKYREAALKKPGGRENDEEFLYNGMPINREDIIGLELGPLDEYGIAKLISDGEVFPVKEGKEIRLVTSADFNKKTKSRDRFNSIPEYNPDDWA